MGEVLVELELENFVDRELAVRGTLEGALVRRRTVRALVDTGAVRSMFPQDLVEALGLRVLGKVIVTYADERREERDVAGGLLITVAGRSTLATCVVGPPGSEPLLGQVVLEETDLLVDPANQRLVPRPESPFLPTLKMK